MIPWHCFKCKVRLEENEILMNYQGVTRYAKGMVCPKCRSEYLSEDVVEAIKRAEEIIDDK